MAQVTSRYNYPDVTERKVMEQHFYDLEARKQLEQKLSHLDEKARDTVLQLEAARQELYRMRTLNKGTQQRLEEEEAEVKGLHTKVGSLKVKLGVANAAVATGTEDRERLRASVNELQVEVARLEERLAAASTELDRMRDPANPESNMSIRKHVASDKKEIKRLKAEIGTETDLLEKDRETVVARDAKVRSLDKELAKMKASLKECENDRQQAQDEEESERKKKEEFIQEFQSLKIDRQSYDKKLKELRVKLGISVANQNVMTKLETELKNDSKMYTKRLTQLEKKLREASGQLDVLKNQHKMSKTAQSINEYTRRNQAKRGPDGRLSLAQSGAGPIQFGTSSSTSKDQSKPSKTNTQSLSSIPDKLRAVDAAKEKQNGGKSKQATSGQPLQKPPGGNSGAPSQGKAAEIKQRPGVAQRPPGSRSTASGDSGGSKPFVPPPKPKLSRNTPR